MTSDNKHQDHDPERGEKEQLQFSYHATNSASTTPIHHHDNDNGSCAANSFVVLDDDSEQSDDLTAKANNSKSPKKPRNNKHQRKRSNNQSWASGNFSELFGWDQPSDNKPPLPNKRNLEAEFHDKNRRFLLQQEREKMRINASGGGGGGGGGASSSGQSPSPNAFSRATSPSLSSTKGRKRLESIEEMADNENTYNDEKVISTKSRGHTRINSDEVSTLSVGSMYSQYSRTSVATNDSGSTTSSQLSKYDLERIANFEKQQQESFERAKEQISSNLATALEQRKKPSEGGVLLTEKEKDQFIRDYMDELEREREALIQQWKSELAAERERIGHPNNGYDGDGNDRIPPPPPPPSNFTTTMYKTFIEPCLESIGSFLATSEVFLANLPLTIGAVGLSWVTMGTVWFKFMEENVDFCIPTHYYEKQCTFPEYPGCFECDTEHPTYILALQFHYVCNIVAGVCCVLFFLKVVIAREVVIDELSNPTTSTPMGVVCIAIVCVFAGQGWIGETIVLVTSISHFMLAIWFLYMAIYKFGLWPDPGWFPSTVGISYAAVKTWLYFPTPGLIILSFAVVFFFGIFFLSVARVALNKKIAAPLTWITLSAPSITLYGLTLVAQPTPYKEELLGSENVLQLHNNDWMIKHYMPFQHFMMILSLVGLASALHGLTSRWEGFRKKPFSPAHVAFCFPTLSHTNAVQAYRGAVNAFSSFAPGSPFKVALYLYWVSFLVMGTVLNLIFTYMYIRRLPEWTKLDTAGEEEPPDPEHTFVHEMLDGTGAHELLDQPFMNPAVLEANEAGALVRVRRGTEDYRIHGPYVRTRKVTALGFDPTLDDEELRQERAELLDWVAKNAPRERNRTMSNPLILSYLGRDGAPDEYGTFGGQYQHHSGSGRHRRSVTSSGIPGV